MQRKREEKHIVLMLTNLYSSTLKQKCIWFSHALPLCKDSFSKELGHRPDSEDFWSIQYLLSFLKEHTTPYETTLWLSNDVVLQRIQQEKRECSDAPVVLWCTTGMFILITHSWWWKPTFQGIWSYKDSSNYFCIFLNYFISFLFIYQR